MGGSLTIGRPYWARAGTTETATSASAPAATADTRGRRIMGITSRKSPGNSVLPGATAALGFAGKEPVTARRASPRKAGAGMTRLLLGRLRKNSTPGVSEP